MKRKILILTTVLTLSTGILAGCSDAKEEPVAETTVQTETATDVSAQDDTTKEEELVDMANPWFEITEKEAESDCPRLFKAPEGATDVVWMKCEDLADPANGLGPLLQLSFTLDDLNYNARAQYGAAEDADIAGNYVEWTAGPEDTTLANWGEGHMAGKTYRSVNDEGYVDMITWYDVEIGIAYSLSVAAADLDGFDIQAVAEQMYDADNEVMMDMPSDFLQEQAGTTSFDSYDDVIAALTKGQGYAYIKLIGSDEEVLAVTDLVFEADHSAYEASIYGMPGGKVTQLGSVFGNGSAYPLRVSDGILYSGDNHTYETYFLVEGAEALMMKDSVSDGVNSGSNAFSGFTRETNSFDDTTDFAGGEKEFNQLISDRDNKPIIEFTVVE